MSRSTNGGCWGLGEMRRRLLSGLGTVHSKVVRHARQGLGTAGNPAVPGVGGRLGMGAPLR